MMSNKGLNSNEALDESTATNSSVTVSGIRRVKDAVIALDIKDYSRNPGKSDPPSFRAGLALNYGATSIRLPNKREEAQGLRTSAECSTPLRRPGVALGVADGPES